MLKLQDHTKEQYACQLNCMQKLKAGNDMMPENLSVSNVILFIMFFIMF